jgi:hypothetical protein
MVEGSLPVSFFGQDKKGKGTQEKWTERHNE